MAFDIRGSEKADAPRRRALMGSGHAGGVIWCAYEEGAVTARGECECV
jgi:hypothetical protein